MLAGRHFLHFFLSAFAVRRIGTLLGVHGGECRDQCPTTRLRRLRARGLTVGISTGVPCSSKNAPPWDSTVGLGQGPTIVLGGVRFLTSEVPLHESAPNVSHGPKHCVPVCCRFRLDFLRRCRDRREIYNSHLVKRSCLAQEILVITSSENCGGSTGVPRSEETTPPQHLTVGSYPGPYRGPIGVGAFL